MSSDPQINNSSEAQGPVNGIEVIKEDDELLKKSSVNSSRKEGMFGIFFELFELLLIARSTIFHEFGAFSKDDIWDFIKCRFPPLAGIVVGCMLIPQGMAYAGVAGLPPQNGLYTGFAPLIIYSMFGTSRQMGVGPVAIISQLLASSIPACSKICFHNATASKIVFNITDPYPNCPLSVKDCPLPKSDKWTWNPDYQYMASSVALFSGILMVILAPVLGWCMSFVPRPVTMGFTTGGGIMIALGQVKDVYGNGIAIRKDTLQVGIPDMCNYIGNVHGTTFGMGFGAAVFLFFMRKLGQGKIFWWKIEGMPKWVIAISLLPWPFGLVLLYTAVNASSNLPGVAIVGVVPPGLPPMSVPPNFNDSIPKLLSVTVLIIIVGYLESIAVETKFANQFKYQINPTQESFAQGWANIFAGLTSSYPAVGSFSRSATNAAYGAKSPVCNFVTAMVIMICLLAMTQYLYNMPKVILASIVIVAALSLVEWPEFVYLLRKRRFFDFVTMVVTFCFTCFYSLEMGVYVGFCVSVFVILFKSTRPRTLAVNDRLILMYLPGSTGFRNAEEDASSNPIVKLAEGLEPHILVCSIEGDFTFSCAGQCKRIISTKFPLLYRQLGTTKVVLDLTLAYVADSTSVKTLTAMIEDILSHDIAVCLIAQSKVVDCIEPVPGVDLFASFAALEKSGWLIQPPGQTEIAVHPSESPVEAIAADGLSGIAKVHPAESAGNP